MKKRKTSEKIPLMDMCQTPGYGVEPLLKIFPPHEKQERIVWECAAGEGYLASALKNAGMEVVASDVEFDFLVGDINALSVVPDTIITNPPFSLKDKFTRKALEYYHTNYGGLCVALLMQSEIISTKWFWKLVKEYGEPGVIWFNPRINFKMPLKGWSGAGSHFSTAWFTWGWFTGNRFVNMEHWNMNYRRKFEV